MCVRCGARAFAIFENEQNGAREKRSLLPVSSAAIYWLDSEGEINCLVGGGVTWH